MSVLFAESANGGMLQDVISAAVPLPEEFSIDDPINLDICEDADFYFDDLPTFSPPAATSASTATSSSGGPEGPTSYIDDHNSFTFDPSAISTIYEQNQIDVNYQLPMMPVQDQLYMTNFVPMNGYVGLDTTQMSSCSLMDMVGGSGSYLTDAMSLGLFSMAGMEPEMLVSDGGGGTAVEGVQRVYSSGDMKMMGECRNMVSNNTTKPLPTTEISGLDNVCRLTAEQRKEKIHRYLKKRNERNFSKKIKYACRKTLADNRPRVRGRFAKNDEIIGACSNNHGYDEYEVRVKEDQVLSPDNTTFQWCDLLEIGLH